MNQKSIAGGVFKTLVSFSVPYFLSCFMQILYGMADLFIIGQFGDVSGTAAVSAGSQVMHMLTVMIVGLAMGSTVLIGKASGAGEKERTSLAVGNTVSLFLVLSLMITAVLLFLVNPIVSVMSTPSDAVQGTTEYLTICFLGIPFITAYNIVCSVFRGMGDSKRPMYFVAAACFTNIALDYLFIGALHMDAAGAALATVISQAVSVIISIVVIKLNKTGISPVRSDFYPQKTVIKEILKVGVPISLQDGFIQVSFLIITVFANMRGLNDAAAVGIVEKIICILFLVPSSMLSAVSAMSAQYIGAKKNNYARLTFWYAIIITVLFGIISAVIMQFYAQTAVGIFTGDATVIKMGGQYLKSYVWDCVLAGIHFCFSGYFCACGLSGISFLHNFISIIVARIPLSYIGARYFRNTLFPMGLAPVIGSCLSVIICTAVYACMRKREITKQRRI